MNLINNTGNKDFLQSLDAYDRLEKKLKLNKIDTSTNHFQHACYMVVKQQKLQGDLLTYVILKQNYEDTFKVHHDTGFPID